MHRLLKLVHLSYICPLFVIYNICFLAQSVIILQPKYLKKNIIMKTKFCYAIFAIVFFASCSSKMDVAVPDASFESAVPSGAEGDVKGGDMGEPSMGEPSEQGNGQSQAGRITAGEWNDLNNWLFWSNLMTSPAPDQTGENFSSYSDYWSLFTNNRVAVKVADADGNPIYDAQVTLARTNGTQLWTTRTDNNGNANLWIGTRQLTSDIDNSNLVLSVNGVAQNQNVTVTKWGEETQINQLTTTSQLSLSKKLDIAFIVDATGSMSDEISFLQADLNNIIQEAQSRASDIGLRTASVFYRDEGDEYITRVSDFSKDIQTTTSFINRQHADGGGDYPEAVHSALEAGLQQLSWTEESSMRLAFLLLDAPPHTRDDVIASLQNSIQQYAAKGIRIIPIAASGVDKPTEFFLRFSAILTNGTYVFITNDSGIGNDHIQATVGDYEVELLRDLIVRLIVQYM